MNNKFNLRFKLDAPPEDYGKLIYEFDTRAREAVAAFAPLSEILKSESKARIGRAKFIREENLSEFDEILKLMGAEFKAISQGGEDVV